MGDGRSHIGHTRAREEFKVTEGDEIGVKTTRGVKEPFPIGRTRKRCTALLSRVHGV